MKTEESEKTRDDGGKPFRYFLNECQLENDNFGFAIGGKFNACAAQIFDIFFKKHHYFFNLFCSGLFQTLLDMTRHPQAVGGLKRQKTVLGYIEFIQRSKKLDFLMKTED